MPLCVYESGVFTEVIENFGVPGVQVRIIVDDEACSGCKVEQKDDDQSTLYSGGRDL